MLRAGAYAAAFTPLAPVETEAVEAYERWIAAGAHGGMKYLERHGEVRADPRLLFEPPATAGTMIVCAFSYFTAGQVSPFIARYAQGEDYHRVLRQALAPVCEMIPELYPGSRTRVCVDSAPLRERYWAQRAGLGFIARNGALAIPRAGTYFLLAEIVTDAVLPAGVASQLQLPREAEAWRCPAGCRRCVDACPTNTLHASSSFRHTSSVTRCLSYLTIEAPAEEFVIRHPSSVLSPMVYGCDICQRVCPLNAAPPECQIPALLPRQELLGLRRGDFATLTSGQYRRLTRGSAMARCSLRHLRLNAGGEEGGK